MSVFVYEVSTSNDIEWEYLHEPATWLKEFPWHMFNQIVCSGKGSSFHVYYRRRKVTDDEMFEIESDYLRSMQDGQDDPS